MKKVLTLFQVDLMTFKVRAVFFFTTVWRFGVITLMNSRTKWALMLGCVGVYVLCMYCVCVFVCMYAGPYPGVFPIAWNPPQTYLVQIIIITNPNPNMYKSDK